MKWIHLSDLHYNPMQDGTDTNYLREKLKEFLIEKKVQADKIFLTGDFRDASKQDDSDENAEKVVQYIREIVTIKIVMDGRVRQFNCRVPENGMTYGVEHSPMISVGTGDLVCIIRNNQYSDLITYNHRFILSKAIWKVIGMDTTTPGVTKLRCKRELKSPYDDLVLRI